MSRSACGCAFQQADNAEESAISDDGDDVQRIADVRQRITIDDYQVGDGTNGDATKIRISAECRGCVDTDSAQDLFGPQSGGRPGTSLSRR